MLVYETAEDMFFFLFRLVTAILFPVAIAVIFYCLDKKTGETLWCHRFSSSLITCVYPVGQEALIVTTMGGGIHYMKL